MRSDLITTTTKKSYKMHDNFGLIESQNATDCIGHSLFWSSTTKFDFVGRKEN